MDNSSIADLLKKFADLSELHGGNPFKIRSFGAASFRIDKYPIPLADKTVEELEKLDGVGKSLAKTIFEINQTGSFAELEELIQLTPSGVMDLFKVKGIGPKKIAYIWNELGIESIGELLYACKENRLAQAKGFGQKTQESIIHHIEFMMANANRFHYSNIERIGNQLLTHLRTFKEISTVEFTGAMRRKIEIIDELELLVSTDKINETTNLLLGFPFMQNGSLNNQIITAKINGSIPLIIHLCNPNNFASMWLKTTGNTEHLDHLQILEGTSEKEIYAANSLDFIEPELRENRGEIELAKNHKLPKLIEEKDLKGILHNHTNWSDGVNTLEEMALYCKDSGYEYLGICDHSKTAFYANGLNEQRVLEQFIAIDELNKKLAPFKVFKGIESDILFDGQLDYPEEILKQFDFIVASVHSNLKMNEDKAMDRLIRAIENPYTTILGHPTGRLLLMREGYPVDHKKMIDACADNGVIIELNANPYRLDLDWRWIGYALEKGVKISINPDAHEKEGYHDMHFGVCVARKGGLTREMCFNALGLNEISQYFSSRKK